jgi:hypothetical protein
MKPHSTRSVYTFQENTLADFLEDSPVRAIQQVRSHQEIFQEESLDLAVTLTMDEQVQ